MVAGTVVVGLLAIAVAVGATAASRANGLIVYQAFLASTPGSQIFAVDPSGGPSVDLSGSTYGDDEPAVSPAGDRIAFRHGNAIWVMNVDGGGRHQVGGMGSEENPSWSPDGTALAFTTDARPDGFSFGGPNVWTMKADGTARVQLTANASSREPAWAPNGSKIAFVVSTSDNRDIYSMNIDGTGATDLTRTATVDESEPEWSPDSQLIAYTSTDLAGHGPGTVGPDLWTMKADGSGQAPLMHHQFAPDQISDGADPAWSPDGTQIAFVANNGTGGIRVWRVAAGGGHDVPVSSEPGNPGAANPSWQVSSATVPTTTLPTTTAPTSSTTTTVPTSTTTTVPTSTTTTVPTSTTTTVPTTVPPLPITPACTQLTQARATMNSQIDIQENAIRQQLTGLTQTIAIANAEDVRRQQNALFDGRLAQQGCGTTTVPPAPTTPACSQLSQARATMNSQIDIQENAIRQQLTGQAQTVAILNAEDVRRQQNTYLDAQSRERGCVPSP